LLVEACSADKYTFTRFLAEGFDQTSRSLRSAEIDDYVNPCHDGIEGALRWFQDGRVFKIVRFDLITINRCAKNQLRV
jgi:hypothetical protein